MVDQQTADQGGFLPGLGGALDHDAQVAVPQQGEVGVPPPGRVDALGRLLDGGRRQALASQLQRGPGGGGRVVGRDVDEGDAPWHDEAPARVRGPEGGRAGRLSLDGMQRLQRLDGDPRVVAAGSRRGGRQQGQEQGGRYQDEHEGLLSQEG